MLEEAEISPADPPIDRHRPPASTSGDVSHMLQSIFKDFYSHDSIGKDTLSNLFKKRRGGSSYLHTKYVEELQQVQSEYTQHIKEADMLEGHIIQARAQTAATEKQAYEKIEKSADGHQDVLTVQSAFSCCVDNHLLKMNNLIAPQDYMTSQRPRREAPAVTTKVNPAKPTIVYAMHISREPQDDGYTWIPSPDKNLPETSELSLTFESSSDTLKRKTIPKQFQRPTQTKPRPKWIGGLSAKEEAEVIDKIQKMKRRQHFLRNPRSLPPVAQQRCTSLIRPRGDVGKTNPAADPLSIFLAEPSVLVFSDYAVGHIYETTLELKNMTSASRQVRVVPPTTSYFSIGLGRFPGEGGIIAPGMSCKYSVRFSPDSLGEFEDFILVETQMEQSLVVPIVAKRLPPVLTLPRVLDCGYCLIGGVKFVEFQCQNIGFSAGTFCIIPKSRWPLSNLRSVGKTCFTEQPPFAVSPSVFALQPGEATVVEVVFFPTTAERSRQVFTIVCDNCQVKDVTIEAEGQMLALELMSVSGQKEPPVVGEVYDLTAEHFIRFSPCNPHAVQQKKIIIRNNVHLELPFHWQIMKPNLQPLLPGDSPEPSRLQFHLATDHVFHVSRPAGVLAPCQEEEFLLTFCPKELKDYHSVCHLVLRDIPQLPPETCDNGVLQPVRPRSKVSEGVVMEIEVKGSTELYQVLLEPYDIVIPGEVFIFTSTRRLFKMWNHSRSCISFHWERRSSSSHIIDVEPSTGTIEENECFDFELIVTGEKPGKVVTSVLCHIEHHHEPVTLAVEVSFKGPIVTIGVPSVDFGLLKLGEQTQTTLLLSNITQLEASWTLRERQDHQDPIQMVVTPSRGVLPPLASCSVTVLFMPRFSQHYESELELTVEHGTGCYLSVRADVQSPQVCLLNCELLLSELYVGVPAKSTVTFFNQTLLPAHFTWMAQLKGKHAELCAATFDPSSGTLGPNASLEVTVNFIPHTDVELTEVVALCEVQGMNSPLVLSILASKTKRLSVSYSLPGVSSAPGDETSSTLLLDFGDNVILKRAVTKQFLITNQSAIPAPFTVEAEYFTCHAPKPNNEPEKKFAYIKKPLHSIQAKKLEEKAHEEFVDGLLAHGKGAALFVSPSTGTLGPFQTQAVDVTAYTDMWGEYRDRLVCRVGDLQPTLIPVQMEVKGCPLYFQMTGPRTDSQKPGPLLQFGTHVSGGDTVSRMLRVNNPSMFDIRLDWETYNVDPTDSRLVDMRLAFDEAFPLRDTDDNVVFRRVFPAASVQTDRGRNQSPDSDSSSTSRTTSGEEAEGYVSEEECQEEEACPYPQPAKKKLLSVHIRPHMGNLADYPYCVTPQQIVIPAKGSSTVHVSFTPLTLSGSVCESRCAGLALGFMSLDSQVASCVPGKVGRAHGLDVEPVRVNLLAAVKAAGLVVQMEEEDDEGVLVFHASAGDLLKGEPEEEEEELQGFDVTQSLQLRNSSEMVLQFTLGTQPPFTVVRPQPRARTSNSSNPSTGESQSLVLQAQHNMQVKVAFHCSLSLLDHVDQPTEELPPGVTVVHKSDGQRRLKFEQNLLIHYSNNSLQTVPLCALMDVPTMRLSSTSIDFGFCYVGRTRTADVVLCSLGASTSWRSHLESEEGVFTVTPDSGCLKSKELHVPSHSQCLNISFTACEDREFKGKVLIRSPLVRTALTLQLQGTGSFDERHTSDL